jgi:hypothetical protein
VLVTYGIEEVGLIHYILYTMYCVLYLRLSQHSALGYLGQGEEGHRGAEGGAHIPYVIEDRLVLKDKYIV